MRILPIFVPHAGCRHACVYCNQVSTSQSRGIPEANLILRLVDEALCFGQLDEVAFYGGSFTALPISLQESLLGLVKPYIEAGQVDGIRVSTRPDAVDAKIVDLLKNYSVKTVELGCQSFSDPVLEASGRGHLVCDAISAAELLRLNGFTLGIQLMPGLPGAGRDEALASLDVALSLEPGFLRVYPTVVLDDTPLANLWRRGEFEPLDLETAVELCVDIELSCRSRQVPVIRYGLQANEELSSGAVLAGPYHPAFGQLVRSRLWRRALQQLREMGNVAVRVHPSDLSDALGHRKGNRSYLESLAGTQFTIEAEEGLPRGTVAAENTVTVMTNLLMAT